jgi:hypothetical protein
MKKIFLLTIVLTIITNGYSIAQEPLSFRNKALGGIVNDDLDLIYDPIELRFVDSLRLYTNLSNLTSGQEQLFNNYSDNEFLIGASKPNPFYNKHWLAALLRFQKSKYPNPLWIDSDLNGSPDIFGDGELQSEYTEYLDLGTDGLYDLKRAISQQESYVDKNSSYSFILNNSLLLRDFTMGLKLAFGNRGFERDNSSNSLGTGRSMFYGSDPFTPSFNLRVDEFYLDSNYSRLKWSESGDFDTENDNPFFKVMASVMGPVQGLELRGDLLLYTINNSTETDDKYLGGYEYFNPNIANYSRKYSENDMYENKNSIEGTGFGFGLSVRRTFDKQSQRKNDGFYFAGVSAAFESFDYKNASAHTFLNSEKVFDGFGGLLDFEQTIKNDLSTKNNGDGTRSIFTFNGRINVPLVDGIHFGIGGFYTIFSTKVETKYIEDSKRVDNYSRTDNIQNALDYVTTITSNQKADRTMKQLNTYLIVPVGIEYRFTESKSWAIRFGSVFQYGEDVWDDAKQITDSKPTTTRTERGDGSLTVTTSNNRFASTSEHRTDANSRTLFTHGLGWNPTENLQVDVYGFFEMNNKVSLLEYFKNLRLSFAMKF